MPVACSRPMERHITYRLIYWWRRSQIPQPPLVGQLRCNWRPCCVLFLKSQQHYTRSELAWKKFPIPRLKDPHSRFAITYATISGKYPTTLLLRVLYPQLNKTAYLFVQNKQQSGEKMYACPARVVVVDQSTNK
ncbi:hypothetical protein Tsp_04238 [Trichinella spiralis]|uniref:hypothetical protein n=1 Tax=Trichinella spiralis TaxID=6334 RepID=UPI0001EFBF06|nr:hypothetical protein Tsp_04238 [Trichinella spiralis]